MKLKRGHGRPNALSRIRSERSFRMDGCRSIDQRQRQAKNGVERHRAALIPGVIKRAAGRLRPGSVELGLDEARVGWMGPHRDPLPQALGRAAKQSRQTRVYVAVQSCHAPELALFDDVLVALESELRSGVSQLTLG